MMSTLRLKVNCEENFFGFSGRLRQEPARGRGPAQIYTVILTRPVVLTRGPRAAHSPIRTEQGQGQGVSVVPPEVRLRRPKVESSGLLGRFKSLTGGGG